MLQRLKQMPLLWNVFPLHPHQPGAPFSNRRFTARELTEVEGLNAELLSWLKIKHIVAIGQDAGQYAGRLGVRVTVIRHPSYGGVREFREGMQSLYPQPRHLAARQAALF
ncbi:hypothetical protein ACFWZ4_07480 [Frateuria sp. GZRe12]|uniref:hypothetical protein n=1 Tax=Frateuria sp. GZRe12 TaxID=3351533 RepID=UPI003EDC072B